MQSKIAQNFNRTWRLGSIRSLTGQKILTANERALITKLEQKFSPTSVNVTDVSGGCGSMYAIEIESAQFAGKSLVKQHQLVQDFLKDEISKWHGLQLSTKAPKQ